MYRGILLVCVLVLASLFTPPVGADEPLVITDKDGYTPIFNGRDFTGWTMQWPGIWEVDKGVLVGKQDQTVGKDSWFFTDEEWDDFVVALEFKMTENCNSGIGIRMPKGIEGRPSQYGYEIQISDIDKEYPTGSIFRHVSASKQLHKSVKWYTMSIICVKDHIVVYLDKQKVVDARLEGSKKGRIGLQVHGGESLKDQVVQFRNIRIKDLKPQYKAKKSPIAFKAHQLDNLLSEGCTVCDINRDGKLDITCGPRWYEGPDWKPHELRHVEIQGEYMSDYGEVAMDVNRDGWVDIVSGGWFTPIMSWFENPGEAGGLWKEHIIANDLTGTEAICGSDVDGDGMTDILVNRYNDVVPPAYFAYVGLERNKTGFERRIFGKEGRGHGMGCGDVNGDGRSDVITPSGWYEGPLRPATQQWIWHEHNNFHAAHSGVPILVEDLNLDGLPDVVYGHAHDFGLYWLEQTRDSAGRVAWISHTIDDTYSQIHCPLFVDLDGDGTKDLIAGKRYRGHNGSDPGAHEPLCLFWYKVEKGPDPQFTKHILTYDENIGAGMTTRAVDIDFDGDIDVVTGGKTGLYFIENLTN